MPDVKRVTVQLEPPKDDSPGNVTEGCYIIESGWLIMTHPDGRPVDPSRFRAEIAPGQSGEGIAAKLTREVRLHLLGLTSAQDRFRRKIEYPKTGAA